MSINPVGAPPTRNNGAREPAAQPPSGQILLVFIRSVTGPSLRRQQDLPGTYSALMEPGGRRSEEKEEEKKTESSSQEEVKEEDTLSNASTEPLNEEPLPSQEVEPPSQPPRNPILRRVIFRRVRRTPETETKSQDRHDP